MMPVNRCLLAVLWAATAASCTFAQDDVPPTDSRPASTNAPGRDYPRVDPERRAYFRVHAPDARSVRVSLGNTELKKDAEGTWTGVTEPLDPGFHYYQLIIDGFAAADPDSESFFGSSNMRSGIEIPDAGVDFYDIKDVPHGEVRIKWMHSQAQQRLAAELHLHAAGLRRGPRSALPRALPAPRRRRG